MSITASARSVVGDSISAWLRCSMRNSQGPSCGHGSPSTCTQTACLVRTTYKYRTFLFLSEHPNAHNWHSIHIPFSRIGPIALGRSSPLGFAPYAKSCELQLPINTQSRPWLSRVQSSDQYSQLHGYLEFTVADARLAQGLIFRSRAPKSRPTSIESEGSKNVERVLEGAGEFRDETHANLRNVQAHNSFDAFERQKLAITPNLHILQRWKQVKIAMSNSTPTRGKEGAHGKIGKSARHTFIHCNASWFCKK